jgi:CheY-like chemotaxis protein
MKSILIIEDNRQMRELMKSMLSDLADHIAERSDGAEALAAYAAQRPDWVLMDIAMPTVDGLAATRQIKAAFPEARVMIVTNYDDPGLRQAASEAGAAAYVLKANLLDMRRLLGADERTA